MSPWNFAADLEPLCVLVEHRIDNVDESLVTIENAVPAGQQVSLEPSLALVLAQHLHHSTIGCNMIVALDHFARRTAIRRFEHGAPSIRRRLVWAEDPEVARAGVEA